MYLEEAKDYFPEIDKEWDLERLFQDFRSANKGKQPTLNVQIVLKGLIGGYSPKEIGQSYRGYDKEEDPGRRIRVCIHQKIIPVIKKMTKKDDNEKIEWHEISRLLSRYKVVNNSIELSLKNILLQLDYTDQIAKFTKSVEKHLVGTFAIHGNSKYHGQVWLLNRIFDESNSSDSSEEDIITIKIKFSRYQNDMQQLWNDLGNQLKRQNVPNYSTETIINSLVEYWDQSTTRKLWFSLHLDCEFTPKMGGFLTKFMKLFWCPLVQKITAISNDNDCSSLYLFFVDERGNLENWKPYLKIADGDEPILSEANIEQAYYPIDLGQLENWTWPVVRRCVSKYEKYLMTISGDEDVGRMKQKLQSIFDRNNQALSVMREICDCCNQSYDEIIGTRSFQL